MAPKFNNPHILNVDVKNESQTGGTYKRRLMVHTDLILDCNIDGFDQKSLAAMTSEVFDWLQQNPGEVSGVDFENQAR